MPRVSQQPNEKEFGGELDDSNQLRLEDSCDKHRRTHVSDKHGG
jgi:hypothetical protein